MTVTEMYVRNNYLRYVDTCVADDTQPKSYGEWRDWFIETFDVQVRDDPVEKLIGE